MNISSFIILSTYKLDSQNKNYIYEIKTEGVFLAKKKIAYLGFSKMSLHPYVQNKNHYMCGLIR